MLMSWSETRRGGVFTAWFGDPRDTGLDNWVSAAIGSLEVDLPWLTKLSVKTPMKS